MVKTAGRMEESCGGLVVSCGRIWAQI